MIQICSCCNDTILLTSNSCHNILYNKKNKALYYKCNTNIIKLNTQVHNTQYNYCNTSITANPQSNTSNYTNTCNNNFTNDSTNGADNTIVIYDFIGIYSSLPIPSTEQYTNLTICAIQSENSDPKIYIYVPIGFTITGYDSCEWNCISNMYFNCDNCITDVCAGYIEKTINCFITAKFGTTCNMKYCYTYPNNSYKKQMQRSGEYLIRYNVLLSMDLINCMEITIGQQLQNDIYVALLKYNVCNNQNEVMCISTRKVTMSPTITNLTHEYMHHLDIYDKLIIILFYNTNTIINMIEPNVKLTLLKQ